MSPTFAVRHAVRELRSGFRRIGWFLSAIAMGVAALVALYGFQRDASESARSEARFILGGDLRIESSVEFDPAVERILEALSAEGVVVSRGVTLATLVVAPQAGIARLLQVNAVDSAFPAAGRPVEDPPGSRAALAAGGGVVADPQVLGQLQVAPGSLVRVGTSDFEVLGSIQNFPVDFEVQWAVGPPLFMALADLDATGLLAFGSLVQHRAWVAFDEPGEARRFLNRNRRELRETGASVRTAGEEANSLEAGFEELARFLSLVGLMALILGGIGVGSATAVYLSEKRVSIAVLRCLGARRGTVLRAYLLQSAALGAVGAIAGVAAGIAAQFALPAVLGSMLPFELTPRLRAEGIAAGFLIGTWVSIVFALLPVLRVQGIPPLAALRSGESPRGVGGRLQVAGVVVLVWLSVLAVSWLQLGAVRPALVVTSSLTVVFAALAAVAWTVVRATRSALPSGAPFAARQGLAGLFRPGNQTVTVVTALGLGAFLICALLVVERGLRAEFELNLGDDQTSLVLFDIQTAQADDVRELIRGEGLSDELIPLVPARLEAIAGQPVSELLLRRRGPTWMYRRVYRNTYRAEVGGAEELVQGVWWGREAGEDARVGEAVAAGAVRVSLESDLAQELGVTVGDRITWDVQGVPLESVVSSIRAVEWASFDPNFFAVFEPGALDGAPATFLALLAPADTAASTRIQRGILADFPNVSFLDVALVRETLERIAGQVTLVLRSMAGFIMAGGALVLFASLLATRFRRRKESALLKTMGASGATIRGVLLSEYAAIGAIAGGAGVLLGGVGGRLLLSWQFDLAGRTPWMTLAGLWVGILVLAVVVGWSVSGPVLRATPMSVLREEGG